MTRHRKASFRPLLFALCAAVLSTSAQAIQMDSNDTYRFMGSDFTEESNQLTGICITGLPEANQGTVWLKNRFIRPGDVLTAEQVEYLSFHSPVTEEDITASIRYLPIFTRRVEPEAVVTISIHGREDKPPIAEDSSIETYKNLPNTAQPKAADPEQQPLTYTLVRPPKRGTVEIQADGAFLYTPKHNKVGTDSFTYTASDPAGNVSREATITVKILKPTDSRQYTDTTTSSCRFSAEWMRSCGLFSGEIINGQACFCPDKSVSRGQFLSMLMEVLDLPTERNAVNTGFIDDAPLWLKPYLAAALRSGLISGYPAAGGIEFRPEQPITGSEASAMIENALNFSIPTVLSSDGLAEHWAEQTKQAAADTHIPIPQGDIALTRADTAQILYQLSRLKGRNPCISSFFSQ